MVCDVCKRDVEALVLDEGYDGTMWPMCSECKRCTDIMEDDMTFLTDPRYAMLGLGESMESFMLRMHTVLLGES